MRRDAETGVETIRAHFDGHAYDPHFHDAYLVGLTEQGVQQFSCRRSLHRSTPGRIILIEPGEVHDGHAPEEAGFTYRMLYLDARLIGRHAEPLAERRAGPELGFRATLMDDPQLAGAISTAFSLLHSGDIRLARDAALDNLIGCLADRMIGHAPSVALAPRRPATVPVDLRRVRDLLHARMSTEIGLNELATMAGTDRFRLTRAFRAAYGLAPHAYLVQLRLIEAWRRLARGDRPADVAAAVGFADQSHLGRWFHRAYRLTPTTYRKFCTNVPDRKPATG
ncbi:AraC family ligand binding domain-containing protein [Dongia soli]|uniref:AraC family transcriptional regulator n=1 Tax=Dongia soli TaxID=600628 RepID=A0ABU5EFI5_9PROT|nr:AraC family transcriptional regulator [Dongia soli]MDY0885163.1 AraC family transcriptional regulator [Dongia soli]